MLTNKLVRVGGRRDAYSQRGRAIMRDRAEGYGRPGPRAVMRDRGRIMRDVNPRGPSNNVMGPAQILTQFGWIGPAMATMGNTARWACSLNPDNEVIAGPAYPLESMATSPAALVNAAMIACAGQAGKTITTALWPAVAAATTLDLAGNTVTAFGARVKIANSITNFKFASYEIQFAMGATVLSYIIVEVTSLPVDIIILGINNNAGKATVVGAATPAVIFPYSAVPGAVGNINAASMVTGDLLYAETLNMRDIGNLYDAVEQGAILI